MEWYFFEPERVQRLYNCSFYDVNSIPLEERTHPLMGISWIIMFCFFESLYIPCLWAMRKLLAKPCYKFMFYVGCADVVALWINALLAGCEACTWDSLH
ncbi:SRT-52 protein [Aphelenchoides avenae]|nr:SRT-52 protein [Aphelenchus avenae]